MKTTDAHPLGVAWVTFLFLSIPVVLLFGDYGARDPWVRALITGAVSAVVTFSVVAVIFWISQFVPVRLPTAWLRHARFEDRAMYRALGVGVFRTWLLRTPFRRLNQHVHLQGSSPEKLRALKGHMETAEAGHVIAFVWTLALTVIYARFNSPNFIPWLVVLNVVGNVYPVLLQRMNRLRVQRAIEAAERSGRT